MSDFDGSLYRDHPIALLTQHGKERVIAPALEAALGCRVVRVDGFDTDQLGTFTREIPRTGSQRDAARRKARVAMERSGHPYGLGSEGAFGPDPMVGMLSWNVEMLVFVDATRNLEVVGHAQGRGNHAHTMAADWQTVEAFAAQVGFAQQQLVLSVDESGCPPLSKGLGSWPALETAFACARLQSATGRVWVETDLRAHANPTRMEMIRRAAEDLAQRLQSRCPACGTPGFWQVERVAGLPCAECGAPTRLTRAWVYGCQTCDYRESRASLAETTAPPERCDLCNP